MDYLPPYDSNLQPPAFYEMVERATQSRAGDPVLRLFGNGTIRAVELRPHSRGGGYIGDVRIQKQKQVMSGNVATYRFGRGWQSSIRDNAGDWNPTQGGFRDVCGAGTRLVGDYNTITISAFRVALFQHSGTDGYDFTEKENVCADDFPNDRYNDADLIPNEPTQLGEILSEVSFKGDYQALRQLNIPAYRHRFYYALDAAPGAIKQFRTVAKDDDGKPVFNPALVRPGFNSLEPSNITLSYGVRFQDLPGFTFTHGTANGGVFKTIPQSATGDAFRKRYEIDLRMDTSEIGFMSTSATGGFSVGLYAPKAINGQPIQGGDRRLSSRFTFARDGGGANLVYKAVIDGMHQGEQIYGDFIVLFGSRSEILQAVRDLQASGL